MNVKTPNWHVCHITNLKQGDFLNVDKIKCDYKLLGFFFNEHYFYPNLKCKVN